MRLRVFILVLSLFPQLSRSEDVKVVKMGAPIFVTLDRRPDKDIKYSKCIAVLKAEKGDPMTAAVAGNGDRACPAAESIKLDIDTQEDKAVSDGGNTETSNFDIPQVEFDRTYAHKGHEWKISAFPRQVKVKERATKNPSEMIEDKFFAVWVQSVDTKENMLIACDKAGSVTEVFESMHKSEKPLVIGDKSATSARAEARVHK